MAGANIQNGAVRAEEFQRRLPVDYIGRLPARMRAHGLSKVRKPETGQHKRAGRLRCLTDES